MSMRDTLAAAATITDVTDVSPTYRQNPAPGQGSVRLDRRFRDASGHGWMDAWQVVVFLPQNQAAAETWLDAHLTDLMDAVETVAHVTDATPARIQLDAGTVPGVIVEAIAPHQ